MSSEMPSSAGPAAKPPERHSFFRESGWMIVATVIGGGLALGVHFLSKLIPAAEYGTVGVMLAVTILLPTLPLQMVFAHQAADALATGRQRQLSGTIRVATAGLFVLWVVGVLIVWLCREAIIDRWVISNPAVLWVTLGLVLATLWLPIVQGLLQGAQKFLWLGWLAIIYPAGRLGFAALIVLLCRGEAAGVVTGLLLGVVVALGIGGWHSRALWLEPAAKADRDTLLRQVVPLMLGFGATQFLFTADVIFVKGTFPEDAPYYIAAGTLGRALVWLVLPIAMVMFPKIVHSVARSQHTNLMPITLACTAVLAVVGAGGLWLTGPWLIPFVFTAEYLKVASEVLPWYAGAMVPLVLANVLINDLLARGRYRIVPWMILLAVGYGFTLSRLQTSLISIPQALAVFCTIAFLICAAFTRANRSRPPAA